MTIAVPLAACYFLGLLFAWRYSPGVSVPAAAALALTVMAAASIGRREKVFAVFLCLAAFFSAAFSFEADESAYSHSPLAAYISSRGDAYGTEKVRGKVLTTPLERGAWVRFELSVERVRGITGLWRPVIGRAAVYVPSEQPEARRAALGLRIGDMAAIEGRLEGMKRLDPETAFYYRSRGVHAFLFAHEAVAPTKEGAGRAATVFRFGETLRGRAGAVLDASMPRPYSMLMGRMIFGRAGELPREIEEAFRRTGVIHVLVVSGLHVATLIAVFLWLALLWRRAKWPTFIIMSVAIGVFYAMTGGGPTVARASVMGLIMLLALTVGREYDALSALCWAGLLMMVFSPHAAFNLGARMSFLACLGIIVIYPRVRWLIPRNPVAGWPAKLLLVSLSAQAPLYPLIAAEFGTVSLVSPVSNLIIVPLSGAALIAGMLLCALGVVWSGFAAVLGPIVHALAWLMLFFVRLFDSVPFRTVDAAPSFGQIGLYAAVVVCLLLGLAAWRERRSHALTWHILIGGLAASLLAWSFALVPPERDMRITFIDVGEGDSALVEAPCGVRGAPVRILIDGGGRKSFAESSFDPGERIVGRALRSRRVGRLDAVIVSHPDEDHLNGLLWALENVPVGMAVDLGYDPGSEGYRRFQNAVARRKIPLVRGRAGLELRAGSCLSVEFLHPPGEYMTLAEKRLNDVSQAVMVRYGDKKTLFTGDLQMLGESLLVERFGTALKCDVMKVPHHGSGASSSWRLLKAASPRIAVISVGRGNRYGHPSPYALRRYAWADARVLRSDVSGDITLLLPPAGGKMKVISEYGER